MLSSSIFATIVIAISAIRVQAKSDWNGQAQFVLGPGHEQRSRRPNIVFILTDDQDLHMNSLDYVPFIQKHLIKRGTLYKKHFCTTAICCPSRVSILTGKLSHNTNVTDVSPPYGEIPVPAVPSNYFDRPF